ncbi:biopolymer transporter ExbD [Chelativorans salis]|uniref:Biopolymer transporter ExbD n=1 Tax=Chelativorans salis TaxID=2978478 RepID=A0ABT2LJB7_9HYPH|nr:biopolymer transporter ExbD [Chelativorans sp. EGI FJ00035]MCT7374129.1 biopolymer transporter ExbD [Chelativorans sp. EGI FJ00035]
MSHIPAPRRRPKPDFSLTMVNVVFLLLLFYLAAGTLVSQSEFEAEAPVTADLPLERLPRPLLLVTEGGAFLDGARVDGEALVDRIREAAADAAFLNVLADRDMPAAQFLGVVAEAGKAGAPIRIVTVRQPQEEAERP